MACPAYNIFNGNLVAVKANRNKRYISQVSQVPCNQRNRYMSHFQFHLCCYDEKPRQNNLWRSVFWLIIWIKHHYWGSQVRNSNNQSHHLYSQEQTHVNDPCCLLVCLVHTHKVFSMFTNVRLYPMKWNHQHRNGSSYYN